MRRFLYDLPDPLSPSVFLCSRDPSALSHALTHTNKHTNNTKSYMTRTTAVVLCTDFVGDFPTTADVLRGTRERKIVTEIRMMPFLYVQQKQHGCCCRSFLMSCLAASHSRFCYLLTRRPSIVCVTLPSSGSYMISCPCSVDPQSCLPSGRHAAYKTNKFTNANAYAHDNEQFNTWRV